MTTDPMRGQPGNVPIAAIVASAFRAAAGWVPHYGIGESLASILEDRRERTVQAR